MCSSKKVEMAPCDAVQSFLFLSSPPRSPVVHGVGETREEKGENLRSAYTELCTALIPVWYRSSLFPVPLNDIRDSQMEDLSTAINSTCVQSYRNWLAAEYFGLILRFRLLSSKDVDVAENRVWAVVMVHGESLSAPVWPPLLLQ